MWYPVAKGIGRNQPVQNSTTLNESHRANRLRAILGICRQMTSVRGVPTLQELIVKDAKTLTGVNRVSIFLFDRERGGRWAVISRGSNRMRVTRRIRLAGRGEKGADE